MKSLQAKILSECVKWYKYLNFDTLEKYLSDSKYRIRSGVLANLISTEYLTDFKGEIHCDRFTQNCLHTLETVYIHLEQEANDKMWSHLIP